MEHVLQLRKELEQANDRNFRLVQQISGLRRDVEMARSDDGTLERLARRYLSMVRPGEVLYHVPPMKPDGKPAKNTARSAEATSKGRD
jgi:cell division protein FtsB